MPNKYRGEVEAILDGQSYRLADEYGADADADHDANLDPD